MTSREVQASGPSPDDARYRELHCVRSYDHHQKIGGASSVRHKAAKLKAKRRKPALSAKLIAANQAHIIEAGLATDSVQHQSDRKHAHGARAPPNKDSADEAEKKVDLASLHERLTHRCGLLDKREVLTVVGVTYPTLWSWMRRQTFPRSRIVGGKSKWLAADVADWLNGLPPRMLKGDDQKQQEKEFA